MSARRQGVGEALMQAAIRIAKGTQKIALSSNPMRAAANNLYVELGNPKKRETNAYLLML